MLNSTLPRRLQKRDLMEVQKFKEEIGKQKKMNINATEDLQNFLYFGEKSKGGFHGLKSYLDFGQNESTNLFSKLNIAKDIFGVSNLEDINFSKLNPVETFNKFVQGMIDQSMYQVVQELREQFDKLKNQLSEKFINSVFQHFKDLVKDIKIHNIQNQNQIPSFENKVQLKEDLIQKIELTILNSQENINNFNNIFEKGLEMKVYLDKGFEK